MKIKSITFSDIQTSDLIYYDEKNREKCLEFCRKRDIDYLPSLSNSDQCYNKAEDRIQDIENTMKVQIDDFIFSESLLGNFKKHRVLFVYSNKDLTGVVHFSDYNRSPVDIYLYSLLSSYEKALRKLLVKNGLNNEHMISYFEETKRNDTYYRKRINEYNSNKEKYSSLPPFEKFYLRDLIELAKHKKIIDLSNDEVINLRNDIMHAHELVNKRNPNQDDYIYDIESFEKLFKRVRSLLDDIKRVNNQIAFSEI